MNYYQFHIGDYAVHTRHLSLMEDLAYRRLLDWYYTNEQPIPLDHNKAAKLVGMSECVSDVSEILSNFFIKSDAGYINKRCDKEISKYKEKADRAKNANSHRWKSETDLKSDTSSDADRIPTTNQEPLTTNQEKGAAAPALPFGLNHEAWQRWIAFRRKLGLKPYKTDEKAKSLAQHPPDVQAWAVQHSIENQYQGLFPEKFSGGGNGKTKQPSQHLTPVQRVQQTFARLRDSGENLDSGGADLRGEVVDQTRGSPGGGVG